MSDKRVKSKRTTAQRQTDDKSQAADLIKIIEHSLYHESPGLGGWFSDTFNAVKDKVNDGITSVKNTVSKYIWDTSANEAVVESWVKNTFNNVQSTAAVVVDNIESAVSEARDAIIPVINNTYNNVINNVADGAAEIVDNVNDKINETSASVDNGFSQAIANINDKIDNISVSMPSMNFDGLAGLLDIIPLFKKTAEVDLSTYVTDGLAMYDEQKKLAFAIQAEEAAKAGL